MSAPQKFLGSHAYEYTHHSVQNAVFKLISEIILDEITEEIWEAEYFTLLVDETKDLLYTFECDVHKEFIGFRGTEDLNAESLSGAIQDEIKQIGINIKNLVAQGYDGAAVMSGRSSGV